MHSPVDSNSDAPGLDLDRPLPMRRLVYLEEADEVTIGSPETDTYAVFPADGAELVRMLADGLTPREAAERYRTAHGESVDIADLVEVLAELDLLRRADTPTAETAPVRWQRLGGLLFGRPALLGYALVTALAAVEMLRVPALVPRTDNLFFTTSYTLVVLLLFFGQAPLLALHEAFHALAGRRLGLRSRLSVGHRLVYLVLETSLDGLVSVPRRQRYLPVLAGMLADVLAIAVLTLIADMTRGAPPPSPGSASPSPTPRCCGWPGRASSICAPTSMCCSAPRWAAWTCTPPRSTCSATPSGGSPGGRRWTWRPTTPSTGGSPAGTPG